MVEYLFPDDKEEAKIAEVNGLRVLPDVMFTNKKNVYKPRIEKRQRKLLGSISFIKQFLEPDEKLLVVTTGCSPMSLAEQLFTGWIIFYLKRSLFIFTDRRVFHVPSTSDFKYRRSLAEIRYSDCASITARGSTLTVKYNNGKKERFYTIASSERAKLRAIVPTFRLGDQKGSRTFLCPTCGGQLSPEVYECPGCRQRFKSKKEALKFSWIFPGGGYFYTGHYSLGVLDALTETVLTVGLVVTVIECIQDSSKLGALAGILFLLAVEKLMTVYHSNSFIEEYLPRGKPA